jgi:peptide/nickel transport system permease protein
VATSDAVGGDGAADAVAPRNRHARTRAAARIVGAALATLFVISLIAFVGTSASGRDVARNVLGRGVSTEQLDAYAEANGLNRPIYARYASWLGDFATGDWGISPATQRPVRDDVLPRFKNTIILAVVSLLLGVPIALLLGVFMARRRGSPRDMTLLFGSVVVAALPEFVVGIGLMFLFAVSLGWLPVDSTAVDTGTIGQKLEAYALPAMTLMLGIIPYVARIARESISETLRAPYTRAALLRGLPRRRVVWGYGVRNAAVPLVNAVAINIVYLLSGVIVVENVFAFPGIGQLLIQAIGQSDTNMVLAITMLLGAMFIALSFIADLFVVYFNPRLKAATS